MYVIKNKIWPALNYEPHRGQDPVHRSMARHRRLSAGRRFGKSMIGGHEFIPEAVYTYSIRDTLREMGKQRRFWIVGPDYSDCEKEFRILWADVKRLRMPLDKPGSYYNGLGGFMHLSLWDGLFQVHCKSARYPEGLDGEGLFGIELVEAAKLKPHIWGKYIRPALSDERGWSLGTSTPEGKNWFYRQWQWGQDKGRPGWDSWRKPSWENDITFPGGRNDPEILDMEAEMSGELFNQQVCADFTEYVGRVFKDFDEELHVGNYPYNPSLPIFAATDYGWTNPFVWLGIQIDAFKNVYVIGEYRVTRRDINDICKDLLQIPWARAATDLYPEPAEPDDTAVLEKQLKLHVNSNTGGELKWRLELIREHLKYDPASEGHPDEKRKPRLFIDRSCIGLPLGDGGLIREMNDYRYPDTQEESRKAYPELPIDKDNHGPEALGRFFRGYFGGPAEDREGGRIRIGRMVIRNA